MSRMPNRLFTRQCPLLRAKSLLNARQSLEEGWQGTQTVSFTNTGIKHVMIAMANVGARTVHTSFHTLRAQAPRIGTGSHGRALPLSPRTSPFPAPACLGVTSARCMVAKATSASHNYKVLGDCFVQSGLSRPKPQRLGCERLARCRHFVMGVSLGTGRVTALKPT